MGVTVGTDSGTVSAGVAGAGAAAVGAGVAASSGPTVGTDSSGWSSLVFERLDLPLAGVLPSAATWVLALSTSLPSARASAIAVARSAEELLLPEEVLRRDREQP